MRHVLVLMVTVVLGWPQWAAAACPVERAAVKVGADADASLINLAPLPATIHTLRAIPAPRPLPQERRLAPVETTVYSVAATIVAYRVTPEGNIHLVLADAEGKTIVAQIPDPVCAGGSRFLDAITDVRRAFLTRFPATETLTYTRLPVEVRGVGFFDFLQGQYGLAPNGLSLYPVIDINFVPFPRPNPPALSRRRAVRAPGGCVLPSLVMSVSKSSVCGGETTTVSWQASDAAASVSIDGIGAFLPSSGNRTMNAAVSTAYSGRATNACGSGSEAVAIVAIKAAAGAELTGPGSVKQGASASLAVVLSGASSWNLTSSLGNSMSPSLGTTSGTVRYDATKSGTDVVTLRATGGCGSVTRTITIIVTTEPGSGRLSCCDGTTSPTCTDCNNKQGCCSGHGGVCGCPKSLGESIDW
jgi:hypothetical protein